MRAAITGGESAAKGVRPVPAYASTAPQAKTSAAGVMTAPALSPKRSGAMYATVPSHWFVAVWWLVASTARAMPKSMTFGLPSASSTLLGLRSRWMTPAPWIAVSAVAMPIASACRLAGLSGPRSATTAERLGPSTYSTTRYGRSWSGSASSTSAVQKGGTCRARLTSLRKRRRNSSSTSRSARIILIATCRPSSARAR
jgi:hypothetical protein